MSQPRSSCRRHATLPSLLLLSALGLGACGESAMTGGAAAFASPPLARSWRCGTCLSPLSPTIRCLSMAGRFAWTRCW